MEWNGKTIPLFGSLSEGNGMEHSFLPIPSKSQIFIPPKLGGIGGNGFKFNDFFTKHPKMPLVFL